MSDLVGPGRLIYAFPNTRSVHCYFFGYDFEKMQTVGSAQMISVFCVRTPHGRSCSCPIKSEYSRVVPELSAKSNSLGSSIAYWYNKIARKLDLGPLKQRIQGNSSWWVSEAWIGFQAWVNRLKSPQNVHAIEMKLQPVLSMEPERAQWGCFFRK